MFRLLCVVLISISVSMLAVAPAVAKSGESNAELNLRLKALEQENTKIKLQHQKFKKEILNMLDEGAIAQDIALDLEKQIRSDMKISGYADVEYKNTSKAGDKPGFRMHHFSLFYTKKINDKWSLFSEIEYEDAPKFEGSNDNKTVVTPDPDPNDPNTTTGETSATKLKSSSGKIFLEAMNLDYRIRPEANIRIGRFFTPAGIWSIDHYPPFVGTQERPMHIRKIFPQLIDGLMSYGRIQLGGTFLRYDVYAGNGEDSIGHGDQDSHKSSGVRLSLEIPLFTHIEFGLSSYEDDRTVSGIAEKKEATGYHVKVQWNVIDFQAEYATSDHTPVSGNAYFREGFYSQLMLRFGKYAIGVRNDFYNEFRLEDKVLAQAQQYEKSINSLFFNYRLSKDIVLKLEYHQIEPDSRLAEEYNLKMASIAVNLGN